MSVFREGQLPLRAASKSYVEAAIAAANIGGATQNSFLVSGGQIVWVADYDFIVSAATYYIDGVLYNSSETAISLDAADPTNDRIDVLAVDNTGSVVKVTGTAAAQPSEPDIDPGTQLKLGIVFVAALSTAPTVGTELLYFENAGGPGEWNWAASGASFNVNSSSNPKAPATKDIEVTTAVAGHYAQGTIPASTYDTNTARLLILYIRSKATWANNRGLTLSLRNAGVLVGQNVTINRTGSYGFDSSITGSYQLVAIPITAFAIPIGQVITQLRITAFGNGHGMYIGDISFQEEGATQPPTGLTLEQATALFASKSSTFLTTTDQTATLPNSRHLIAGTGITFDDATPGERTIEAASVAVRRTIGMIIGDGTNVISTGVQGFLSVPTNCTIISARLLSSDPATITGSIVVDIWNAVYASYPPVVGDSIVGGTPPTITTDIQSEDTSLTGWNPSLLAGDILAYNVNSVSNFTRVNIELLVEDV